MLKFGVTTRQGVPRPRTLLGRRRYVSFLLLRELVQDSSVGPDDYDRVAGHACMPNGVWKLTQHGRLHVLDDAVQKCLEARHPRGASLVVCDLAASTGATSIDFFRTLQARFDVRFIASDLYRDLVAVRSRRWPVAVVFDGSGNQVQYVCGRFVLPSAPPESIAYPVNRALKAFLARAFLPSARAVLDTAALRRLGPFESLDVDGFEVVKLPMLTRNTLATISEHAGFSFEEWNIFERIPERAHVVRAMNILTPEHFSNTRRQVAIRNCIDGLLPGGLFVVGSSPTPHPNDVQASIYAVDGDQLVRLASVNGGSEVDAIVADTFTVVEDGQRPPGAAAHSVR
jgi:hypothetical protein